MSEVTAKGRQIASYQLKSIEYGQKNEALGKLLATYYR